MTGHVTESATTVASRLPEWVTLLRAPNPGPMTLDGTNTWLLRAPDGSGSTVVVDPGPADPGHLAAIAGSGAVTAILVTHGHPDHVEGLAPLSEMVWGRPAPPTEPTRPVEMSVGGLHLTELVTPGHTHDSVSYLVAYGDERVVLTGDTILGRGTAVVAHPDGDLTDYLASLELLAAYEGIPALPGHGPALADCGAAARFYLDHRHARLDQVRRAVATGATTPAEVVAVVYADVDRSLWWAAEWSVRAQLEHLDRENGESRPGVGGLGQL